ncbi:MAG: hypothetical protein CL661_10650 [Bacteroidetes bacterium]|jgi:hypothetical protein|nr:hypothetical protein [Bacteroidota bacterium]|tara:strand:+ start:1783 stop:2328 length:546 start_codon:yes stop_codon:yes gene_type:complete
MKYGFYILIILFVPTFFACQHDKNEVITEKIQYDVNIKSPDPEYDWWIQNLVGPQREKLVDLIIDGAKSGKWQAYDYFNNPIDKLEVRDIFSDTMIVTMRKNEPPYDLFDTTIINNILPEDIIRLRFLEEWCIVPENLNFSKKIIGLAPVARRLDFNGIERWQPLFWIYTDDKFIEDLKIN